MTLKQGDIVVLDNDTIDNIHLMYKLGLNIYIGSYTKYCVTHPWSQSMWFSIMRKIL